MEFVEKYSDALTPYGKARVALVFHRLGDQGKADSYLDRALDGSRTDKITGVFWVPEKISWLWYNDSVEKHAFFIKTLLELRPKDSRIAGMVQWLLFNRKGNEWKSTRASAAAVYSLLDVLKVRGAIDEGDTYRIQWGGSEKTVQVDPLQWLAKPIRFSHLGTEISAKDGQALIDKKGPGIAFASMTWIYSTEQLAKASSSGLMDLQRSFFRRVKEGGNSVLKPIRSGDVVNVGDEIEVQLKISTKSQFEYVHLKDPKAAGMEADTLLSGWKWDQLSRYEEPRDSLTNFFMSWVPHGEYLLRYKLRPTTPGKYRIGPAVLQSMYAPEMTAYSDGFQILVEP